ncbi:hypothetical protein [Actinoplanes philippinensis]
MASATVSVAESSTWQWVGAVVRAEVSSGVAAGVSREGPDQKTA